MTMWLIYIIIAVLMIVQGNTIAPYLPFLCCLILIAGVSFWDDVKSLPDSVRLVAQFSAMALAIYPCIIDAPYPVTIKVLIGIAALIVFVGATNIINFMDGINGITAGYALAILLPLLLLNRGLEFIEESYLIVAIIGVLVFCIFNLDRRVKRNALQVMWAQWVSLLSCCLPSEN